MNKSIWPRRYLRYIGIALAVILALYLFWGGFRGFGSGDICAGISLIFVIAALVYLKRLEERLEFNLFKRIRAEYPSESQAQVFEIYKHLKTKELEYLFEKVLDDAHGNIDEVKKYASIAESIGRKDFLESHF